MWGERALLEHIDAAADRLAVTAARLEDEDLRGQARHCPGWTRGHVLTHVARSSEALRNLLVWARTGIETPAYPSPAARDAAIEAGAGRPVADQLADLRSSAAVFRAEVAGMPPENWWSRVRVLDADFPAWQIPVRRLVEIELHHTDLDTGYEPADWPAAFTAMELDEPMRSQRRTRLFA